MVSSAYIGLLESIVVLASIVEYPLPRTSSNGAGLDSDKGAPVVRLVVSASERANDVFAQAVELLQHQVESHFSDHMEQVFTLNPEGTPILPGGPAKFLAILEGAFIDELREPTALQGFIRGDFGQAEFRIQFACREVRIQNQQFQREVAEHRQEFSRSIKMVEQPQQKMASKLPCWAIFQAESWTNRRFGREVWAFT